MTLYYLSGLIQSVIDYNHSKLGLCMGTMHIYTLVDTCPYNYFLSTLCMIMQLYHKDKQTSTRQQRPDISIISIWQEQFLIQPVETSGTLKENNLKANNVFLNINITPDLQEMVDDVIVLTKNDNKVE